MRLLSLVLLVACATEAPTSGASAARAAASPVTEIAALRAELDAAVDRLEALERQQASQASALAAVGLRFVDKDPVGGGAPCLAVLHEDGAWGCENDAILAHNIGWTYENGGVTQTDTWERRHGALQQQLCDLATTAQGVDARIAPAMTPEIGKLWAQTPLACTQ